MFDTLENEGFFFDPVRREVEEIFMVGLIDGLNRSATAYNAAQTLADELIKESRNKAKRFEMEAIRLRKELRDRLAAEEAERLRLIAEEEARLKAEEEARLAAEAEAEGAEE